MSVSRLGLRFVAHGETEAQVMEKVAEHAKKDHGMYEIPEHVATKPWAAIGAPAADIRKVLQMI
jgi:predicted small metal-binding protein